MRWFPGMGSPYLLYGLGLWLFLCEQLGEENFASIDLWGKLSIPAVWLASGRFPVRDFFSYTAYGHPWTDHEWLAGFAYYAALWAGGDAGLTLLKWLAVAAVIAGVLLTARIRNQPPVVPAALLLIGLPIIMLGFISTGRPQMFTFAGLSLLFALLEWVRAHQRFRLLWWLLPVGLLWANLHGGFIAGMGILVLYGVGEAIRRKPFLPYWGAALLLGLGGFVNPYGLAYWKYLIYAVTLPRPEITEWDSVPLWSWEYLEFKLLAVLTLLGVGAEIYRRRRQSDWTVVLVLLVLAYLGGKHLKHQMLFLIGVAALLPPLLPWAWGHRQSFSERLRSLAASPVLPGLLCLLAVIGFVRQSAIANPLTVQVRHEGYGPREIPYSPYPVGAVEFLARSPYGGNLLVPFAWGEFAYWRLYPKFRVSIDGRLEAVYPMETFRTVLSFYNSEANRSVAECTGADFILAQRSQRRLRQIEPVGAWQLLYRDNRYLVYGRKSRLKGRSRVLTSRLRPGSVRDYSPVSRFFNPAKDNLRFRHYAWEPMVKPQTAHCPGAPSGKRGMSESRG